MLTDHIYAPTLRVFGDYGLRLEEKTGGFEKEDTPELGTIHTRPPRKGRGLITELRFRGPFAWLNGDINLVLGDQPEYGMQTEGFNPLQTLSYEGRFLLGAHGNANLRLMINDEGKVASLERNDEFSEELYDAIIDRGNGREEVGTHVLWGMVLAYQGLARNPSQQGATDYVKQSKIID